MSIGEIVNKYYEDVRKGENTIIGKDIEILKK